jgi:hypothetical protein
LEPRTIRDTPTRKEKARYVKEDTLCWERPARLPCSWPCGRNPHIAHLQTRNYGGKSSFCVGRESAHCRTAASRDRYGIAVNALIFRSRKGTRGINDLTVKFDGGVQRGIWNSRGDAGQPERVSEVVTWERSAGCPGLARARRSGIMAQGASPSNNYECAPIKPMATRSMPRGTHPRQIVITSSISPRALHANTLSTPPEALTRTQDGRSPGLRG